MMEQILVKGEREREKKRKKKEGVYIKIHRCMWHNVVGFQIDEDIKRRCTFEYWMANLGCIIE